MIGRNITFIGPLAARHSTIGASERGTGTAATALAFLWFLKGKHICPLANVDFLIELIHVPSIPRRHDNYKDFRARRMEY